MRGSHRTRLGGLHRSRRHSTMEGFHRTHLSGLHRSRDGVIFGVCRGIAEHFDFSVFWVRTLAVIAAVVTGIWPAIGLYCLAALLMKPEPKPEGDQFTESDSKSASSSSVHQAAQRLKRRYEDLDRRIQRMENIVTSREFKWHDSLKS
jgi:phage shock protein C